ncbi:hypothetical protein [Streptomyces sp. Cmuel-A718b]|uniref:hypothetical protein n=1 Tax=Streptomyces sp. Cmuel-A718b TaxID=697328 RepID=UPI00159F1FBB|nr:hypothetical protein [Streptomyces sp. Cmuel-A718b]
MTVSLSGVSTAEMTWEARKKVNFLLPTHRSKFHFTAAESSGVPSVKVTPSRRSKLTLLPSSAMLHDSASPGFSFPPSA